MQIGKIRIRRLWLIIIVIIVLIFGYNIVKNIFKNPLDNYSYEKAEKGEIVQDVSETGSVKATDEVSLSFKAVGKISSINVAVGNNVEAGQVLAALDSGQIYAQLQSAKAALAVAQTQYEKLLAGSTIEVINPYKDAVDSAEHDLQSAYNDAITVLHDAYNKVYNASATIFTMQSDYFYNADQQGVKVIAARDRMNNDTKNIKNIINRIEATRLNEDIDSAIVDIISIMKNTYEDLKTVRDQCDIGVYYLSVSSTDKSSLDTHKTNINTALENIVSSQQTIMSYKIALQKANDNLSAQVANPRSEDINIYKSQIDQAQANVNLYQSQLDDNYLVSPINGKITKVDIKRGQVVTASQSAVSLLSLEPFQIKVDIYEQDIVNVKPGNTAKIELVAFPNMPFYGKVLSIDPGEKIVDNVVYYEVTIDFPNQPEGVMSGMTADIIIETNRKEDVLRVSKNAVENIDGKYIVEVFENKKVQEREVFVGLEGDDYYEITSNLQEGEIIITGQK